MVEEVFREYKPSVDSSLGLVFRLNGLWQRADDASIDGKYDEWNNVLDALWRNLSYREGMIFEKDEGGNVTIKLSPKDKEGWELLCKNVTISKLNWMKVNRRNPIKARTKWARRYTRLEMKDLFLRKKMFELKLYLKETKKIVGGETFGTFGK